MTPEEYAKEHQKAFRTAFDFLNSHFPPGQDPEWWDKTAKECSAASLKANENKLAIELLCGVMVYLGHEYDRRYKNGKADNQAG